MSDESPKTPVYRQRFTPLGYTGATITVLAPLCLAWAVRTLTDSRMYNDAHPAVLVVLFVLTIIGPLMVLVGREHYQFDPDAAATGTVAKVGDWLAAEAAPKPRSPL